MTKSLYLFTELFPYGNSSEIAFLQNEVKYYNNGFDEVIIFPENTDDNFHSLSNIKIDLSLCYELKKRRGFTKRLLFIKSKYFYSELFEKGIRFWNLRRLKRLISFINRSQIIKNWVNDVIITKSLTNRVLLYTFWNTDITFGLLISNLRNSGATIISRAHAHDLYEDKNYFGYLPCFSYTVKNLDKLFLISQDGINYLNKNFFKYNSKFAKMILGVEKANLISYPSNDGNIRLVSCSYVIQRKRIDLIIKGIYQFTKKYQRKAYWTHFGDGNIFEQIKEIARNFENEYFIADFKGSVTNKQVLDFYQTNPVDIFITTSESEGLPVTLQEAQAYGIPIIGTAVNGIPEILTPEVGILLSLNPDAEEIADAIYKIIQDKDKVITMRYKSIENWDRNFNQEKNYKKFIDEISSLV